VHRLEQTLKSIEGFPPELVDKVIALGLIDLRDIEEVGTGPLIEELGLPEEVAQRVVAHCAQEAKLWTAEQAAKKEADAKAKVAAEVESRRALNALLGIGQAPAETAAVEAEAAVEPPNDSIGSEQTSEAMPGTMESTDGAAAEVTVHTEQAPANPDELSPEEQAVSGVPESAAPSDARAYADEDSDTTALAEGRAQPPSNDAEAGKA
jgi:hypothetical protein